MSEASLYTRLGGYDALAAAVDNLLVRVRADGLLGRFWASPRSDATDNRERQLTLDFMVAATGGPAFYTGRAMKMAHDGMGITQRDARWLRHCFRPVVPDKVGQQSGAVGSV
jgi:hemoglobin